MKEAKEYNTVGMMREVHRLLWGWLSDHPEMPKYQWPGWKSNGGVYAVVKHHCFPCDYATRIQKEFSDPDEEDHTCDYCPFEWPGGECVVTPDGKADGLFSQWEGVYDDGLFNMERSRLAKKIRDLKLKDPFPPEKKKEEKVVRSFELDRNGLKLLITEDMLFDKVEGGIKISEGESMKRMTPSSRMDTLVHNRAIWVSPLLRLEIGTYDGSTYIIPLKK